MLHIEVIDITIAAAATVDFGDITLPDGNCKRVGMVILSAAPSENINIALKTSQGTDVIKSHSYKFWEQRQGGDYFDSLKPVEFNCGRKIKVELNAPVARAADTTLQFIFLIEGKEGQVY